MESEAKKTEQEVSDDLAPLYDGVQRVAKFTVDTEKRLEKRISEKADEANKAISEVDEKMEKGFSNVLDRIESLSKRSSFSTNALFQQDDLAVIKEAVPERFFVNSTAYELEADSHGRKGLFGEPRGLAATHAWFNLASKLQIRRYDSDREKNLREFEKLNDRFEAIHKVSMGGQTDTGGGYLVPNIVAAEVLKIIRDASQIYTRARQIPMTSDTLNFPDETTAVTTNWVSELAALTQGEPVLGQKQLVAKKLVGRATFSLELLDDSNAAVLPFLQSCFAEKMGGELDFQAMEGSGSPFTGVLGATSVADAARTAGTNGVFLKYNSTTSTDARIVEIFTVAREASSRDNAIWVCSPDVYAVIIGLTDSNGQPIVKLGTVEGQPNNTLLGRPMVVSARLTKTTEGAGTNSVGHLYFGDPRALLFGVRQAMRWDVTDQVSWATYAADARLVGRFAYVVGVPTAWARQKAIRV